MPAGPPIAQEGPCPVPPEQRPLREYEQLLASWFFSWPAGSAARLPRILATAWLLALPLCLLVASGSVSLRRNLPQLAAAAAVAALLPPLLLLLRQWLGWSYVRRRLLAHTVEYEESGWYDGMEWEKPLAWRQQDLLVARHQVSPVLTRIVRGIGVTATLLLSGTALCQAL
ncbi:MAG: CGLD27 family protein [Cyanobacteriota bacterium]|jgi:hypothetical protein